MALSLIVALILTPALCALILKPNPQPQRWAVWFNQKIEQLKNQYIKLVQTSIHYSKSVIVIFVALIAVFTLFYNGLKAVLFLKKTKGF